MQIRLRPISIPTALCVWASILCASSSVRAEPPAPEPAAYDVTTYTFDDTAVLGDTVGAMGEVLQVRQRPNRESLIRVRESYVRELFTSVEAL